MNSFNDHINGSKPVVVDFFATWCGPCKMMPPILKQVKDALGEQATVLKMDIDRNPSYARMYGVQSVPTLMLFKNGRIIWRKSGVTPANEIIQQVRNVAVNS